MFAARWEGDAREEPKGSAPCELAVDDCRTDSDRMPTCSQVLGECDRYGCLCNIRGPSNVQNA